MDQERSNSDRRGARSSSASERAFRLVVLIGVGLGIVVLAAVGVYGFVTYFGNGDNGDADLESGEPAEIATEESETAPTDGLGVIEATQTPNGAAAATATAACASFAAQFPGTPCPVPGQPGYDATAACVAQMEQFPGTPCP